MHLSVAENYRRDPINRLAKALLDAGAIGAPRLMLHNTIGGSNRMLISVWRHQKDASVVLLTSACTSPTSWNFSSATRSA